MTVSVKQKSVARSKNIFIFILFQLLVLAKLKVSQPAQHYTATKLSGGYNFSIAILLRILN